MSLRVRLVVALVALATVGLAVFGVVTYTLYARSQYSGSTTARASVPIVTRQLTSDGSRFGQHHPTGTQRQPGRRRRSPQPARWWSRPTPTPSCATRRHRQQRLQLSDSSRQPDLPDDSRRRAPAGTSTSGSTSGLGRVARLRRTGRNRRRRTARRRGRPAHRGDRARCTGSCSSRPRRPPCCSPSSAAGSWLILRRGLRPLEQMATTARSITAGDLSQRVEPVRRPHARSASSASPSTRCSARSRRRFAEREATEQRLRQFLADASHELRTPLTSIQGFAELFRLGGRPATTSTSPVILRRIEEESARMKVLVEDLLLLARLDETRPRTRAGRPRRARRRRLQRRGGRRRPTGRSPSTRPSRSSSPATATTCARPSPTSSPTRVRHTPAGTPHRGRRPHRRRPTAVVAVRDHGPGLDDDALAARLRPVLAGRRRPCRHGRRPRPVHRRRHRRRARRHRHRGRTHPTAGAPASASCSRSDLPADGHPLDPSVLVARSASPPRRSGDQFGSWTRWLASVGRHG